MRPRELSAVVSRFDARTPTLPPATHTNSYALGSREVLLVEPATPYEDEQRAWIEWARALPSQGRTPVAIFVTHHHADHVGGAAVLASALDLPLQMHRLTHERIAGDLRDAKVELVEDGQTLALDGHMPTAWQVLLTPGHAPGHVCLFEPNERTIVVGDMVASVGTILIAPGDGHMATYLRQLERLDALGAALALPAHGEPIDAPSDLFRRYVRHRQMREEKVVAAFARLSTDTPVSAEALLPYAYDDTSAALHPIALLSLHAHLEKLVEDGRVRAVGDAFALSFGLREV